MSKSRILVTKVFFLLLECATVFIVVAFTSFMSDVLLLTKNPLGRTEIVTVTIVVYIFGLIWFMNPISMYIFHKDAAMKKGKNKDEKLLLNAIRDVSADAAAVVLKKPPKFKLYWLANTSINAQALGKRKIAVTSGAINTMDKRYLTAILLHEINHLVHGHSLYLISVKASFLSLVIGVISSWFSVAIDYSSHLDFLNFSFLIRMAIGFIVTSIVLRVTRILLYLLAKVMLRRFEFESDEFAVRCGYGKEMWTILDYFAKRQAKIKWYQVIRKLNATHPEAEKRKKRVAVLENKRSQRS